MKCAKCGRDNRAKAGFCAWCGADLNAAGVPGTASAPIETGAHRETTAPDTRVVNAAETEPAPSPQTKGSLSSGAPATQVQPAKAAKPAGDQAAAPEQAATSAASAPEPLRTGTVLTERYEITEVLESAPDHHTYRAKDLWACPACGYDKNKPEAGGYCEACGAALNKPRYVILMERVQNLPTKYDARFSEGERDYYVTIEKAPEAAPTASAGNKTQLLRLTWGRATDKGMRREQNEDYIETWFYTSGSGRLLGLFVVADGLGGHDAGEVASRMATDNIWQTLREQVWEPLVRTPELAMLDAGSKAGTPGLEIGAKLSEAVIRANKAVYDARIAKANDMSTTLTLALIVDGLAYIANVGDSRTYLWNAEGLRQLTKDHSLVQRLVDEGQMTRAEVYTHPQRNLIYKSIGDRPDVQPDVFKHQLRPDDHLVLCSDGLWEMVHDDGIEEVLLSEADPQRASERLVANANLAGGDDNISIIIVQAIGD